MNIILELNLTAIILIIYIIVFIRFSYIGFFVVPILMREEGWKFQLVMVVITSIIWPVLFILNPKDFFFHIFSKISFLEEFAIDHMKRKKK